MTGRTLSMILIAAVLPLSGCAMCDCPYDYAGPTYTPGCGESLDGYVRAGSILSGGGYVPAVDPYYRSDREEVGEPTPAEPLPARPSVDDLLGPPIDSSTFDPLTAPDAAPSPDQPPSDLPPLDDAPPF